MIKNERMVINQGSFLRCVGGIDVTVDVRSPMIVSDGDLCEVVIVLHNGYILVDVDDMERRFFLDEYYVGRYFLLDDDDYNEEYED